MTDRHVAQLAAARALLTPGSKGGVKGVDAWVVARIKWHRSDFNNTLADELLAEENAVRESLGKEPLDA